MPVPFVCGIWAETAVDVAEIAEEMSVWCAWFDDDKIAESATSASSRLKNGSRRNAEGHRIQPESRRLAGELAPGFPDSGICGLCGVATIRFGAALNCAL
jgi:hypothetical protein